MKPRTSAGWERLKPATRRRYERGGITKSQYVKGVSLQAARGHAITPEHPGRAPRNPWTRRALQAGIVNPSFIPRDVWDGMTPTQRENAAKMWVHGYFTKGQGDPLTKAERGKRGILPADRRAYRHFSREQEEDRVIWQQLMSRIHGHTWGAEDYQDYRDEYSTFTAAA